MRIDIPMIIQAHGRATSEIIGIYPEIELDFRGTRICQELIIYRHINNPILFGRPFLITANFNWVRKKMVNERVSHLMTDLKLWK